MSEAEAPFANPQTVKVKLSTPISRKGGDITELTLRKPKAGQMRGLKIEDMEPEDLIELAGAVKGFFMSAEMKAAISKALGGQ